MHEFALAQNILETVAREIADDFTHLAVINIGVGTFSGVVADSLEFGLTTLLADKNAGHVRVEIKIVPTTARCECGEEYELQDILKSCPLCSSFKRDVLSGLDIVIDSLEVTD